jgi:hypothetical protein
VFISTLRALGKLIYVLADRSEQEKTEDLVVRCPCRGGGEGGKWNTWGNAVVMEEEGRSQCVRSVYSRCRRDSRHRFNHPHRHNSLPRESLR